MPLIQNFKSTSILKAFILNAITASLVIVIGIAVKDHFDTYIIDDKNNVKRTTNFLSIFLTIIFTFLTALISYTIMYYVFGFGGGMLIN